MTHQVYRPDLAERCKILKEILHKSKDLDIQTECVNRLFEIAHGICDRRIVDIYFIDKGAIFVDARKDILMIYF